MTDFEQQFARQEDVLARRYDYEESILLVADLGAAEDAHVDVVGETAILVVGDEQHELDLPAGKASASINNGIVTIEVGR